jgi:hypothetical protein
LSDNALYAVLACCATACFIALVWASTKHRRNDTKEH